MAPLPVRFRAPDEDSARWLDFPIRPGDIVISTRSKSGTTWMQMICALLVFQTGRELLSGDELSHYYTRTQDLAPPDLLRWLHRESVPR